MGAWRETERAALPALVVLGAAAALLAVLSFRAHSPIAGAMAIAAAPLAAATILLVRADPDLPAIAARAGSIAAAGVPGLLVLYFSFNGGGYQMPSQALVATLLASAIALRIALAERPFAGANGPLLATALLLLLFAGWTLLSASWSDAPGRAAPDFVRALLYALTFAFFGLRARSNREMRMLVRFLAAAIAIVSAIALTTRLLPHVWPTGEAIAPERLSYPLTYWNALGLLSGVGLVLALHLASSRVESVTVRVVAAAAMPMLATTLYFTFSRGSIVATAIGCVAYVLIGRLRGTALALVAAGPPVVLAVTTAYSSDALASSDPAGPAGVADGKDVALALLVATLLAAGLRLVLARFDRALARMTLPRKVVASVVGAAVAAALLTAIVADLPGRLSDSYHDFVRGDVVADTGDQRERLTDPGNNHRVDQWDAAMAAYRESKIHGSGAGTYEVEWERRRPYLFDAQDAHSLYAEVLGELGIAGLALLVAALGAILFLFGRLAFRRRNRAHYAALMAAAIAWIVHAGVDWDWEMPAVSVWLFAAAGAAGATSAREPRERLSIGQAPRIAIALGVVVVAIVPALAAVSGSRLSAATEAFGRSDCGAASSAAHDSLDGFWDRAQAYEILGYCDVFGGRDGTAHMRRAVAADPREAEYAYGLALSQGARGIDPRPALRTALVANPRDPLLLTAAAVTQRPDPGAWRAWADQAPLPDRY